MQVAQPINGILRRVPSGVVYLGGLIPLGLLVWNTFSGGLGVDPVKELEHQLGKIALQFLLAGLCVTPLRRWTGVNLIRYRRALGLLAFLYAVLHLLVWMSLDLQFRWNEIGADLTRRPYIIVGMAALLFMLPLALTSNKLALRRMGAAGWQRLHRLVYLVVPLGAVHYLMVVKSWPTEPILYVLGAIALVAVRLTWLCRRVVPARAPAGNELAEKTSL